MRIRLMSFIRSLVIIGLLAALIFGAVGVTPAYANIDASSFAAPEAIARNVSPSGADSGDCSVSPCKTITFALTQATAGDTINVAAGTYSAANGETLPLVPAVDVTINGAGAASTFIDGGSTTRVMTVYGGRTITLQNVTIQNGRGVVGGNCGALYSCGGGVFNDGGILTVRNSTFSGNAANSGGGIENYYGTVTVSNSTFSDNFASSGGGGGIRNSGGTLTVSNSTFSGNSANNNNGGGINNNGTLNLTNSTFSGNSASSKGGGIYNGLNSTLNYANTIIANSPAGGDCLVDSRAIPIPRSGTIGINTHNLVKDGSTSCLPTYSGDPLLDPGGLKNNGGDTSTISLLPGSPAIDNGDAATCAALPVSGLDQRGQARNDLRCDIGAYELKYADSPTVIRAVSSATLTTFGSALMGIQRDATFTDPGTLTVTKSLMWKTTPANAIAAYWTITPTTTSGFSLTLQLCYTPAELGGSNEANLRLWRFSGGVWSQAAGVPSLATVNGYRCATLSGINALSAWTLATSEPTAVTVRDLTAQSSAPALWLVAGLIVGSLLVTFIGATRLIKRKRITSA